MYKLKAKNVRTTRFELHLSRRSGGCVATVIALPEIVGEGADAHSAIKDATAKLRGLLQMRDVAEPEVSADFEAIKDLVDGADPEGLLGGYCPPDEYELEVQELTARLGEATDPLEADRLLRDVFGRWFGTEETRATYAAHQFDGMANALVALAAHRRK